MFRKQGRVEQAPANPYVSELRVEDGHVDRALL